MSAHDKAAARHARRFSLTVLRYGAGCMQTVEFDGLTESEVEAIKAVEREMRPENPAYGTGVDFEVSLA
jgi:hypothetical protein